MPGLLRGMARTAVIAGTSTAVSNRVSRRQAQNWAKQDSEYRPSGVLPGQFYEGSEQQQAPPPPPPPAPALEAPEDPTIAKIKELAELHASGVLTDEEFAAAKSRALGV